jgi:hypothetical protein
MKHGKPPVLGTFVIASLFAAGPALSSTMKSTMGELPPAQSVGKVTYMSGGDDPAQASAMRREAANYPLELDFLWGRGAKESPISADWSIRKAGGPELVQASSSGPMILASLPDGHYTVTATYDGHRLTRTIDVHRGTRDTVVLEWPQ